MGRNGKKPPTFSQMVALVNENVGKTLTTEQMFLGTKPNCRNAETNYVYKFIKLGYIEMLGNKVTDSATMYKIHKAFPLNYNSVAFMNELKIVNNKSEGPKKIKLFP